MDVIKMNKDDLRTQVDTTQDMRLTKDMPRNRQLYCTF